jgi:PAS domain S-box-containing protein
LARLRPYRTVDDLIDGVVLTFVNITTMWEMERALEQTRERYRLMAEGTNEYAMLTMDESGRIDTWNQGARRIFGYEESEVIGQNGEIIFTPEDRQAGVPAQELGRAREQGEARDERWHQRKDGSRFWASGVVTALQEGQQLRGYAKVLRDNTTRKAGEEALVESEARYRELAETLEERVKTRTEQVRQLAAELVTAEQAVREELAQKLHEDLQQTIFAAQVQLKFLAEDGHEKGEFEELEGIIQRALSLTRQITMELSPPVLEGEGVDEALNWLAKHLQAHYRLGVTIQANPHPPVSKEDRLLLYQLVRELLFNVVKHAGVKEAVVTLRDEGSGLAVIVSDDGKGFDPSTASGKGKGGFGLPNLHERLELFGGRAEIDSRPGAGTRVTLFIPYRQSQGVERAEGAM